MCGIVGIYSLNNQKIPNLEFRIKKMINMIKYRGPDNSGHFFNKKKTFGMANNQLSIVSPKKNIKLPLTYDNENFLSFNGEIYNYLDLKLKYKIPNNNFRYNTDTEVLYYFLNQEKINLSEINGIWSFAHYNDKEHVLKLGRDILGERNLYYYVNQNELIFSSEIRPIFAANNLSYSINNIGIQDMWKYYSCRDNLTVIKDCFKLTPGRYLIFKKNSGSTPFKVDLPLLRPEKYFDLIKRNSQQEIQKKFKKLMSRELEIRYPKNVKCFSSLSGGLDSTYQNFLLRNLEKKINTIYAISNDFNFIKRKGISEMDLSKLISKKIISSHTFIDLRKDFFQESLKCSQNTLETLDPAILNFSIFSKFLKNRGSKVLLCSDGPDEFLCGYYKDINNFFYSKKRFLKNPYHKIIKNKKFYESIFQKVEKETDFFSTPDRRYKNVEKYLEKSQLKALIYATKSLPEYINIRADKGFMLNSIEVRQPFLSKNLVEFLCALPSKFRVSKKSLKGKIFLRNEVAKISKIVSQYKKTGFGKNLISDDKIFKKLEPIINDTINDKKIMQKLNFKKGAEKTFLKSNRSQKYMVFSLIRSLKNLKN